MFIFASVFYHYIVGDRICLHCGQGIYFVMKYIGLLYVCVIELEYLLLFDFIAA